MDYTNKVGMQILNAYDVYFSESLNNHDNYLQGTKRAAEDLKELLHELPADNLRFWLSPQQIGKVLSSFDIDPAIAAGWTQDMDMVAPHVEDKPSRNNCMTIRGGYVADDVAANEFASTLYPIEADRVYAIGETFRSSLGLGFNATLEDIEIAVGRELVLKTPLSKKIAAAISSDQIGDGAKG